MASENNFNDIRKTKKKKQKKMYETEIIVAVVPLLEFHK